MKNIIIREYLESLTESEELDYIFTILLEVMNFKIISTPRITKGLAQYGKDVVAIGNDIDGILKRYYFEVKGGADKDVTTSTYKKPDGVRESIFEAKDRSFRDASTPGFDDLPIKIVLVHNGILRANVKETFDGFIEREFPPSSKPKKRKWWQRKNKNNPVSFEFERWGIHELTELFAKNLFNEYLLTDEEMVKHFKKVLVLINTPRNDYSDFFQLIHLIFEKAGNSNKMGERKRLLFFETLKMVSFIVYHYSKDAGNLEAARKCIPFSVLKLWAWILENNLEKDQKILDHYKKNFQILFQVLHEYFEKTLAVAKLKDGLWSPNGGRYEQVGYPVRALDYVAHLILYFKCQQSLHPETPNLVDQQISDLSEVLNKNDGTARPYIDIHSIPICLILNFFIENGRIEDARVYLGNVISSIQIAYHTHRRLPDGNNSLENVIRLVVRRQKSVYYVDKTSHLFGIILEYVAVLNMQAEYKIFKDFLQQIKIDLAVFIPYTNDELMKYQPQNGTTHELNLLKHTLYKEGYQSEIMVEDDFIAFQEKTFAKPVFKYDYISQQSGFSHLLLLAHVYFKTPLFPYAWRNIRVAQNPGP